MELTRERFVRMVEAVSLNNQTTYEETVRLAEAARKYHFLIVYGLNCFTPHLIEMLKGTDTMVGAPVGGSPIGADLTEVKLYDARKLMDMGCQEVDIIMNVSFLRSGMYDPIREELKKMRDLTRNTILKVIIESPMLTPDEIRIASTLVADSGADFVKTATGACGPTTLDQVRIIKETVGDRIQIKAAGGLNGMDTVKTLLDMGVTRLGLGYQKAVALAEELR